MGYTVGAVASRGAHRERVVLPLSVHQVIDDERTIGLREKLAEADGARRCVANVKVPRTFFKLVILNRRALREMAAQLRDAFALAHKLNSRDSLVKLVCRMVPSTIA
jgi:hypothetical protein